VSLKAALASNAMPLFYFLLAAGTRAPQNKKADAD